MNNGHVLVVPREHYESLLDVPEEIGMHLFKVTMQLANAVRKVTGTDDLNIVVNSGAAAGQDEPHYHVHIIPRRHGDGFDIPLPFNGSEMPDRTVLDAYAAQIISALRDPMRPDAHSALGGSSGIRSERHERSIVVPVFADSGRKATVESATPGRRRVRTRQGCVYGGARGRARRIAALASTRESGRRGLGIVTIRPLARSVA